MKTRMTRKENRRLSLLVAGTLGMTVALGVAPPRDAQMPSVWRLLVRAARMRRRQIANIGKLMFLRGVTQRNLSETVRRSNS